MLARPAYLAGTGGSLLHRLDDADGNGLTHVTDGKTAQGRVVGVRLDAHGLRRDELDNGGVAGLDELGRGLDRLARAAVDFLQELGKLARNVRRVAVEHWRVPSANLAGVVQHNDLSVERSAAHWRVVLGVAGHVATANLLDGHVLHVEADVVTWFTLYELGVVHLDRLDFSGDVGRGKRDNLEIYELVHTSKRFSSEFFLPCRP